MKVYYAHPISIYNTPQEKRDLELMAKLGYEVFNPNSAECDAGYKKGGMDYFTALVQSCNAVVFRGFADGSIPAGIWKEICVGLEKGLPVLELPSCMERRSLSEEETDVLLSGVSGPTSAGLWRELPEGLSAGASLNVLVFSAFADGRIPNGIWQEIQGAVASGTPILELPSCMEARSLTKEETRAFLSESGHR